jgi:hypothetical protein
VRLATRLRDFRPPYGAAVHINGVTPLADSFLGHRTARTVREKSGKLMGYLPPSFSVNADLAPRKMLIRLLELAATAILAYSKVLSWPQDLRS